MIILIIPLFVSLVAPDNTNEQWSKIFYVIIVLMIVCNGFFFIVGKASPAQWTKVNNQQVYTINQPEMINAVITE
ncbi:unnamed protein product [Brugia timori]|uniref:Uncharacterized protein n=1 Tax=Brugia timori TaxID=42155 RepID=A0A3P7T1Z9_9BILA|nr:unnamed protein product [Brugia timori]